MGYISRTKDESRKLIMNLGLNRVPEEFFEKGDTVNIRKFFEKYKADIYVLRDADHSSGKYFYVKNADECIKKSKEYQGRIIVAVSINNYKNKVLLGAIEISGDTVRICATTDSTLDHRTMYGGAEYNMSTTVVDKRLSSIPEIDFLFNYIYKNNLLNITIEFTIYDRPVGTNNERIIINELRNY
ncbi:MAG: hypothetical protein K2O41_01935 [Clostridia bacterium]|nr:hypothetical protein [Clostridia bacterium]